MPWSRKKSCERCRASKARCNRAAPACSRCSERQLQCVYAGRDTYHATHYSTPQRTASLLESSNSDEGSWRRGISSDLGLGPGGASVNIGVDEMILPDFDEDLGWTTMDDLVSDNLTTSQAFGQPDQESQQWLTTQRDGSLYRPMPPAISTRLSPEDVDSSSPWFLKNSYDIHTTKKTPSWMTVVIERPMDQRTLMRRGAHKSCPLTSAVLGQIVSYPKMMIEGNYLPPFIQPACHIDEELAQDCAECGKHGCLPKDLAVCASLVGMFYERTAANAAFAWNSIYAEGERLRQEYHKFTLQQRLAALQSTMVFLILQAENPDSAAKNGTGTLLATVTEVVLDLTKNNDWHLDIPQRRPDRREWLFRESLKRILVLINIIDLLLEGIIVASASSCHDFRVVPLPSNRDLWGARTNRGWRAEYAKYLSSRKTNNVLTVGDLIESDEGGCFTNSNNNIRNTKIFPDVVKWCEGLDALGTLVWMAMPFEQYRRRGFAQET